MALTSRERIRRALRRQPVDRIPNGWGGCETAGLHNLAYAALKRVLGVTDPLNRVCTFMNNAVFEPSVLQAAECDIILLGSRMCPAPLWGEEARQEWQALRLWATPLQVPRHWRFRQAADGSWWWDEHRRCAPGSIYFDVPPAPDLQPLWSDGPEPLPDDFHPSHEIPEERLRQLERQARFLFENTSYAIACGETIQDLQLTPGGIPNWWLRMVNEPQACHDFLHKACEAALSQLKQLDQAIGKYCELLGIAHDLADARGVTIGPALWRTIYQPHYHRLFTEWHKLTSMKVNLHCCGSIVDILNDLVDCGVDVYNPVQLSARGMDPATLKRAVGKRLIFYGGAFDAIALGVDTPAENVYEAVRRNIEILSEGGGYLFAGVHNLPGDLPEAQLQAIWQAWRDCSRTLASRHAQTT